MDFIARELRFAFRMLVKQPGSSIVAVVAMALGIGLTTSMFSIMDGVFLRGLPFPESDRLLHLERNNLEKNQRSLEVPPHDFDDWRHMQHSFTGLAGWTGGTFNLADKATPLPDRYTGAWISANFLDILEVKPLLGRGFEPADEQPGASPVVLLGYGVWQQRYAGDPAVVGREIRVNSEPATVVGVLPEGFRFPIQHDVWAPLILETADVQRGEGRTLEVFGRLADGVSLEQAAAEMATITRRLADQYPETNKGIGSVVKPYIHEYISEHERSLIWVMFAAVSLILLLACFNVANLLIGRASRRSRELAIRTALGSSRWRSIAQVLSESWIIAACGAALGIVLARFGLITFADAIARTDPPFWFDFHLSARSLLFAIGASTVAALVAGLIPALQASRSDVNLVLQDATRGSTSFRLGWVSRAMVIAEIAVSFGLLIGAGLAVRSILHVYSYDLGLETDRVLTARMGLFAGDHPEEDDWIAFFEAVRDRVAAEPQVASAVVTNVVPIETEIGAGMTRFERPGETYDEPSDMPLTRLVVTTPGYFETFGVPILAGRDFGLADRKDSPSVAIVNQDFAAKEWPGQNPIGQRIHFYNGDENDDPDAGWAEVVGLVPNLRFADFDNDDDQQAAYVPLTQTPIRFAWIVAKTKGDPLRFVGPLRHAVLELDPNLPLYFVRSMDQVLEQTLFFQQLFSVLFGLFGVVAVLLACVGLYGVMAFSVSQRTQEMGVRMALGAGRGDLLRMVLGQGLRRVALGLAIGSILAFGMGRFLAAFLFQVEAVDPLIFALVPLLLAFVAMVACTVPAQRASTVDPIRALHHG